MIKLLWSAVIFFDALISLLMVRSAIHPTRDYGGSLLSQQVMYLGMAGVGLGSILLIVAGWRWRAARLAGRPVATCSDARRTTLGICFGALAAPFVLLGIGMFVYWSARVLFGDVPASMLLLWPVQCLLVGGIHLLALWLAWRNRPWMRTDSVAMTDPNVGRVAAE